MTNKNKAVVVGLGEVLWDNFPTGRQPGGAPANVAYHAALLGHKGVVCSRVGCDEPGDALIEYLSSRKLDTSHIQQDENHDTGAVNVDTSDPERPAYTIEENAAWDHLAWDKHLEQLAASAKAICFGTLAQRSPISRATIHHALNAAKSALRVYDINLRQSWYTRERIEKSLAFAHIAKLNNDEVDVLDGLLGVAARDPRKFAKRIIQRYDIDLVCITRADKGCLLVGRDEEADVVGQPVEVADAVGAGDAFCAAMITARLDQWPIDKTAQFANAVGATVASRSGAMPDVADVYAELRERLGG